MYMPAATPSVALYMAASGASVLVTDINADAAASVVDELTAAGGTARAFVGEARGDGAAEAARCRCSSTCRTTAR